MPESNKPSPAQESPFEIVTTTKSKKLSPKTLIILGIIFLFLSISVFLGVYLVGKRTNIAEKAAPATAIYITPSSQTKSAGSNFTFSVEMDTSLNAVTGVDVRLNFDPSVMQVLSLEQGVGVTDLNQTITNTYDNSTGNITYAIFTLDSTKAVTGTGVEVLKVNAIVKPTAAGGSYNITFNSSTAASASQEGQNVLVSKAQGVLIVSSGATLAPTPTSTATAVPTPTATSNSTFVPTPTATANATPTATATPTPSASPTQAPTVGSPNSCNGTCGDNANCQAGLYCYSGYCRKPSCPTDTSCGCSSAQATNSPTTAPTSAPVAQRTAIPIPVTGTDWPTFLGIGLGIVTIIASVVIAL